MRSDRRGSGLGRALRLAALTLGITLSIARTAVAEPGGAITGSFLVSEGEFGGAGLVDVWAVLGPLRVGGAFGLGFMPSADDDRSRVIAPAGLSLGVQGVARRFVFEVRGRGGFWSGATNDGLRAGGWLAVGGHFGYELSPHVAITCGVDGWFLFGPAEAMVFAPGLGFSFSPSR